MPPKVKITKEDILRAAYIITKENGFEAVNARNIAEALQCSTQPVFTSFQNMNELKNDLFTRVNEHFGERIMKGLADGGFLGMGLEYIRFAKEENNLFRMMFFSDFFKDAHFADLAMDEDNAPIISMICQKSGLTREAAQRFFIKVWLFTHGVASLVCTNSITLSEAETEKLFQEVIQGFLKENQ